jgi:D-alanyl-D-alanine endopeptidase (penicillin-binding protein 7)
MLRLARPSLLIAVGFLALTLAGAPAFARTRQSSKRATSHGKSSGTPTTTKTGLPNVQADAAIIVDMDSGEELFSKNPDQVRAIASVGKLFLALAVRGKNLPLEGATTIQEEDRKFASGGARSRLPVGKTFSNKDLLRAMLIQSDNRACTAVGRGAGLEPTALISAMNDVARALGLRKTSFSDPSGLNGNVSTAREVMVGLKAALADPVIAEILQTPTFTVRSLDKRPVDIEYTSTDIALRTEKRFPILGGKTGYTDEAKYCLAIAAKIDGRRVGMVFLGADGKLTRFGDFNRGVAWLLAGRDKKVLADKGAAAEAPAATPTTAATATATK